MHIKLKNKKLHFLNYKIKCAIGKTGINKFKEEGDNSTPKGKLSFTKVLYRADKIRNFSTKIKKIEIKKNMGWCDDPTSKFYNKLILFPFKYRAERLYRDDDIYDIILVTNYNSKPIKKNKGSAIFIHIAKKNYSSTKGCIAISKRNMIKILSKINYRSLLII